MGTWDASETPADEPIDSRESSRGRFAPGTPEDVAALYTWANLQGARYKDFSASRRQYREQVRARAAQASHGQQDEPLPEVAMHDESGTAHISARHWRSSSSSTAAISSGTVSSGTIEAFRSSRSSVVEHQMSLGVEPETEDSDSGQRAAATDSKPEIVAPSAEFLRSGRFHVAEDFVETPRETQTLGSELLWEPAPLRAPQMPEPEDPAEIWASDRWEKIEEPAMPPDDSTPRAGSGLVRAWRQDHLESEFEEEQAGPAWIYGAHSNGRPSRSVPAARLPVDDDPRRSGARWSALKGVFDQARGEMRGAHLGPAGERRAPLLLVFSLAGGVGKTSLLATLGRALSSSGEKVSLGDGAAFSLLPYYFGARDLRPGAVRAFAPPENSEDAPIFLVNYDLSRRGVQETDQRHVMGEILRNGAECNRIMLDLPSNADWLVRRVATLQPTVLVPMVPDMNSVISLEAVERYFEDIVDPEGNPVLPFYLLNQFDVSLALHLDVREVLRKRLGDRLLSFVIRRSPVVSEALAEGMTVVDYAPDNPVARDYFDVAAWLRTVSPPAMPGWRNLRSATR